MHKLHVRVFSYDFLNIFFLLVHHIVRLQYVIHTTYKMLLVVDVIGEVSGQQ